MNFKQWLIEKYITENSPKGDFARDIKKTILPNEDLLTFRILNDTIIDSKVFNIYKSLKKEYLKHKES